MHKITTYSIITIIVLLIVMPIFMVSHLSVWNEGGATHMQPGSFSLEVYYSLLDNKQNKLLDSFKNSILLSIPVAIITTAVAFFLGLNFWNKKKITLIVFVISLLYFLPGEIFSIATLQLYKNLGGMSSSTAILVYSHVSYTLPYALAIILLGNYQIPTTMLFSGNDLGSSKLNMIYQLIFKNTIKTIISAFLVSFLFSLNEYTRTSYLSGSTNYFSKYIFGKLNSGADEAMYALSLLSIMVVFIIILIIIIKHDKGS